MSLLAPRSRPLLSSSPSSAPIFLPSQSHLQVRHASLIKRPKKPYTFTQLITLSDGSTFTHRTTSPQAVYLSVKDSKNNPLWNPSSQKLLNVEEDEAGRLRRFRERFGRGFDASSNEELEASGESGEGAEERMREESLMDLIAGYGLASGGEMAGKKEAAKKSGKGKGGEK